MARFEHYELWIRESRTWACKSVWRDFEVGRAVACAYASPVRIVRTVFEGDQEVERVVVNEITVSARSLVPYLRSICNPS